MVAAAVVLASCALPLFVAIVLAAFAPEDSWGLGAAVLVLASCALLLLVALAPMAGSGLGAAVVVVLATCALPVPSASKEGLALGAALGASLLLVALASEAGIGLGTAFDVKLTPGDLTFAHDGLGSVEYTTTLGEGTPSEVGLRVGPVLLSVVATTVLGAEATAGKGKEIGSVEKNATPGEGLEAALPAASEGPSRREGRVTGFVSLLS